MAIYASPSDQFNSRSNRTTTGRCRSWMRTWQRGNMPILLKTQIERTAKAPIPACRARVGSLCRFRRPAERVPTRGLKTGRCANVRDRCGHGKRRKKRLQANFGRGRSRKRRSRTKPRGRARPAAVTTARRAGSFGDLRGGC